MPGIIVHNLLALQVLERWCAAAAESPFPADQPHLREAFLHGCMGPDMGLCPGGDALLSDLAHYLHTGGLTRALIAEARTPPERAFAWGWLTHVLGDVLIHPIINRAAGESAGKSGPLTYAESPPLHIAVEIGLDGAFFHRWQVLNLPRARRPHKGMVRHQHTAYQAVYGAGLAATAFAATERAWARGNRVGVWLAGSASSRLFGRPAAFPWPVPALFWSCKTLSALFARGTVVHAFTHPRSPDATIIEAVADVVDTFPDLLSDYRRAGLECLPDFNLDTGAAERTDRYPLTARTEDRLRQRQAAPPTLRGWRYRRVAPQTTTVSG